MVLCYYAQTTSSSVFSLSVTMSPQHGEYTHVQHGDGGVLEVVGCVLQALDGGKGISSTVGTNLLMWGRYLLTY